VKWLTADGLVAAAAVGAAVWIGLAARGEVLLFAFFLSGSILTQVAGGGGGRRNARQVLANGGVAALAALLGSWTAAAGALAAATADTWATEIGSFSPAPPRRITTLEPMPAGASGGITLLGTAGGAAGAAALGGLAVALRPGTGFWILAAAGVLGMAGDSLLGATLQGVFRCPGCGARFEDRRAACHAPLERSRGWRWLDNDGVNLAATLVGAGGALLFSRWLSR